MIPGGPTIPTVYSPYNIPDDREPSPILDFEYGPIYLGDSSEGLLYQIWRVDLVIDRVTFYGKVYLSSPNTSAILIYEGAGITEVSFTFDQNGRIFLTFVANGIAKYYWYDTAIPGYTTSEIGSGARSPKCTLDSKSELFIPTSDIILGYVRNDVLYYRIQRDRFSVEYFWKSPVYQNLLTIGMNNGNRLQFMEGQYP